jgi:hypothetical protein
MRKELGGDRIGSGNKMDVEMKNYERSTHNKTFITTTTAAPGVVFPFMNELGLPDDTWNIEYQAEVLTLPTTGPLFGSFILDIHTFQAPWRLYIGDLHQNLLEIGNNMADVKIPQIIVKAPRYITDEGIQIEPSTLLAHLDMMGIGRYQLGASPAFMQRNFNALPVITYFDIIKCYYANKQETFAWMIHTPVPTITQTITSVKFNYDTSAPQVDVPQNPNQTQLPLDAYSYITVNYTGTRPNNSDIVIYVDNYVLTITSVYETYADYTGYIVFGVPNMNYIGRILKAWDYSKGSVPVSAKPQLTQFPLRNIDQLRINILKFTGSGTPFLISDNTSVTPAPYSTILANNATNQRTSLQYKMEGLCVKTYNSDLFNNWINTLTVNSLNTRSSINTTGGSFTMDALNMAKKVYDYLARIAVAGGTYDDWIETAWSTDTIQRAESPIYEGGLRKEVVFQEVISQSASEGQPLGQLGGMGRMSRMHKGGKLTIKTKEVSTLMACFSLTPRIDYSQGNSWINNLRTLEDVHKPGFDQIGFQDLITDQMAYWDTNIDASNNLTFKSAGKQPAWVNYMTNVNKVRGNFAIPTSQMFMTLTRRYTYDNTIKGIQDLTTYIDPSKYNYIFADASIDAQNFWVHIETKIEVRRKMSAKLMPNI